MFGGFRENQLERITNGRKVTAAKNLQCSFDTWLYMVKFLIQNNVHSSLINQNAPWEDVDVCGALERPGDITIQFYEKAANILKFPVIF